MPGLDVMIAKLQWLAGSSARIAAAAAPRIRDRLRFDATTRRGNVPQYPPLGPAVPIAATAGDDNITVRASGWVMDKAIAKGQPAKWTDIVNEEAAREFKGI